MKSRLLLLLLLASSTAVIAQDYKSHAGIKYLKDTIIYNEFSITPGDTLFLGTGTAAENAFQFVFVHDMDKFAAGPQVMGKKYTNNFLVFKGITEKTMLGKTVPDYRFFLNNKHYLECFVLLKNALSSKELLLPARKYISRSERRRLKKQA